MKKRDVILNTEAHRPAFNDFFEAMQSAQSHEGWRPSETLQYFLDAGFRAIRGRTLIGAAFDANEAEYMKIVSRCHKPFDTMADFSYMLGALAAALMAEPIDFIGPVFSELSADSWMGQFFTPFHMSYMMAKMIVVDAAKELNNGRPYITLSEPACGVGGMVLAANVALRESGFDVARQAYWHMVDVDFRAICGAYLQASLTDTAAIVIQGNSLSLETRLACATPMAIVYPKTFGCQSTEKPAAPTVPPPAFSSGGQLSLF